MAQIAGAVVLALFALWFIWLDRSNSKVHTPTVMDPKPSGLRKLFVVGGALVVPLLVSIAFTIAGVQNRNLAIALLIIAAAYAIVAVIFLEQWVQFRLAARVSTTAVLCVAILAGLYFSVSLIKKSESTPSPVTSQPASDQAIKAGAAASNQPTSVSRSQSTPNEQNQTPSAAEIADEVAKRLPKPQHTVPPGFVIASEGALTNYKGPGFTIGFWLAYSTPTGCALSWSDAAVFLRITSTGSEPEMITSYHIYEGAALRQQPAAYLPAAEIVHLPITGQKIYFLPAKGTIPGDAVIHFRVSQGPGFGSMVSFPISEVDASHAVQIQLDPSLDDQLGTGDRYIEQDRSVRGWVLLEDKARNNPSFYADMGIVIKDQLGREFTYPLKLTNGDPSGDALSRGFTRGPAVNLSSCTIQPFYYPHL